MFVSKKGLAKIKLAGFTLALFILVIWLAWTGRWTLLAEDLSITEQCRASVVTNARYHIAGLDFSSEIDCPTRKIVLEKESQEEAKEKVANAMYTCWKQFGQGKLNLFKDDGVYCNVCYIIDVKTEDPIRDFGRYLFETPSPTENLYYYDYLNSFDTSKAKEVVGKLDLAGVRLEGDELSNKDGENKYATLFVYAKGQDNFEKIYRQITRASTAGKVITPVAGVTAVAAGVSTAAIIVTAPVSVPVIVVVGATVAAGVAVFTAVEAVGLLFNPDTPPEWIAFNVLRTWNPDNAKAILENELGCSDFVETQTN